ncbi:MAG: hypothetical protein Q8O03_07475 [Nanoarchaeota archaeon]|nr:hypothetical protein [Nanoarchaeota archaeon]
MFRLILFLLILTAFSFLIKSWVKQYALDKELRKAQEKKDQLAAEAATVEIEKENKKAEEKLEKEKEKLETKTD